MCNNEDPVQPKINKQILKTKQNTSATLRGFCSDSCPSPCPWSGWDSGPLLLHLAQSPGHLLWERHCVRGSEGTQKGLGVGGWLLRASSGLGSEFQGPRWCFTVSLCPSNSGSAMSTSGLHWDHFKVKPGLQQHCCLPSVTLGLIRPCNEGPGHGLSRIQGHC